MLVDRIFTGVLQAILAASVAGAILLHRDRRVLLRRFAFFDLPWILVLPRCLVPKLYLGTPLSAKFHFCLVPKLYLGTPLSAKFHFVWSPPASSLPFAAWRTLREAPSSLRNPQPATHSIFLSS